MCMTLISIIHHTCARVHIHTHTHTHTLSLTMTVVQQKLSIDISWGWKYCKRIKNKPLDYGSSSTCSFLLVFVLLCYRGIPSGWQRNPRSGHGLASQIRWWDAYCMQIASRQTCRSIDYTLHWHKCTHLEDRIDRQSRTHTCTHTCTHTRMHTHTHRHACTHARVRANTYMSINAFLPW